MILLQQMCILFFIMILGYVMARKRILDEKICKAVSFIIVNIANPALVLSGCVGSDGLKVKEFGFLLLLAFGVFLGLILIAEIIVYLLGFNKQEKQVYKVLLAFSNMGFMGFPLISSMYGSQALLYASVFLLPFNILIYSYGVNCISGQKLKVKNALKNCLNIGLLAGLLSITISLFHWTIPEMPSKIITMLSNLTAPLSMMVIGASFVGMQPRKIFGDPRLMLFSGIKLIVLPLIGYACIHLITTDPMLRGVCLITIATPSGSMAAMLAQQYGGSYQTAAKGIAITTLLSIVTMPIVFAITGQ